MKNLKESGPLKAITNKVRFGSDMVDMIDVTELSIPVLAGLALLTGAVDSVGALLKKDLDGAGEEAVCALADAAAVALPWVEYWRVVQGAERIPGLKKVLGLEKTERFNLRAWARYGASGLYNKLRGGRASSIFKDAASSDSAEDELVEERTQSGHEIISETTADPVPK